MLQSLKELERYTVNAADGDVGRVVDFLFDEEHWVVRYFVVDISGVVNQRHVLISPASFSEVDWLTQHFRIILTKDEVQKNPSVPEVALSEQAAGLVASEGGNKASSSSEWMDTHLRSANEVRGYDVQASDDSIGHVDDFIVEDDIWDVRYLVVDTSNWWFGKKVLVAPQWTKRIGWEQRNVYVDMSRQAIKDSPEYDPSITVNREYESRLYDHYREHGYWREKREKPMRQSGSEFR
jgi:hypothetical protein